VPNLGAFLRFDKHLPGSLARIRIEPKEKVIANVKNYFFFGRIRQYGPNAVDRADLHRTA
jgi:hypothetical protein